jgi:glucans biosynthesis protein C
MENRPDNPPAAPRLHALDNLRALMMWLGIVLHAGCIYMAGESPLPWRDGQRSMAADLLVIAIHAFRMPVFFILAGFFLAMLLQSRGPLETARHRAQRLGLPFALFWLPLTVAIGVAVLAFMHLMARGTWGLDIDLRPRGPTIPDGPNTAHLWFLWLLLWLSLATCALAAWQPAPLRRLWHGAAVLLQRLGAAWWGAAVLVLPLVAVGWFYPQGVLAPSGKFLPPPAEWVHNGLFFAFGLALYHQQWELFAVYRRRWAAHAAAGLLFFLATGTLVEGGAAAPWIALAYNLCTWLWSFAVLGLGLRFLEKRHAALAYLADSAYWVYLVHMPLTIAFGAVLFTVQMPALLKLALNIAATTAVCLASYQFAVRSTWVGQLLNGRRHPRNKNPGGLAHVAGK